jgi:4-hydroxy-4-methyl-2-oxoglutarate aldolase
MNSAVVSRPDAALIDELAHFGVATVHEAQGRTGLLAPGIRPVYPGAKTAGVALTVLAHPGDNLMMHVAAALCRPGDVIVVALSSPNTDAMLGELLATSYRAHGGTGVVLDGGCRDVAELARMNFPVWSAAISAKGTVKATPGAVNIPVVCGGQLVRPGDAVLGDDDGVVVVRQEDLPAVIQASRARDEKEARVRERLAAGELGLDIYGLREKLAAMGMVIPE